ncbi:MAG: hypothetical protein U1D55_14260 [Phycisphaerae bacterium]
MSLARLVIVLGLALAVLLATVTLRAESVRLHREVAEMERRAQVRVREIREQELELARLRNPAVIYERILDLKLEGITDPRAASQPAREGRAAREARPPAEKKPARDVKSNRKSKDAP